MRLDKKTVRQMEWLIVFTLLIIVVCFKFTEIIKVVQYIIGLFTPFFIGMAMAFVINVLMNFIEHRFFESRWLKEKKFSKKLKRPLSLVASIFIILALIAVVFLVVIPQLGEAAAKLAIQIEVVIPEVQAWAEGVLKKYPDVLEVLKPYLSMTPDWNALFEKIGSFLTTGVSSLLGNTFSAATQMASTLISVVTTTVIAFIFSIYILLQKEKLGSQLEKVMQAFLPEKATDKIEEVASLAYRIFSGFITGQCVEACILGTIIFVALSIGRFPYALLIAVLVAFCALIPIFGSVISCSLGAFLIVTESPMRAVAFIILFLVIQQIEGNLIYPKVVGGSIGLPAIFVLMAVTLGGSLMGIVGMLLFIPLTSVLYALFRRLVYHRLSQKAGAEASKK